MENQKKNRKSEKSANILKARKINTEKQKLKDNKTLIKK